MSSLLNWDGSQDAQKRREEESTRASSDLSAPGEQAQPDLTHGSNVGSSWSDKGDAMLSNGHTTAPTTTASPVGRASSSTLQGALSPTRISNRYSQNIQFGSAKTLRTPGRGVDGPQVQATVPHTSDGLPVTRTPDLPTPDHDHDAEKDAARSHTHSQSPTAHVPPRARRPSLQDAIQSDTIMRDASGSSLHDSLPRPHTPPRPQPSPSRIPDGYMEVDEDADGTPDQSVVPLPLPSPSTGADEDAVEAEMVVDDDFSSLRYPSYEGSPTRVTHADVEMPDTPKISTPHALPTALPLSTSQIGPTTSFARPASPTLALLDNAAAGPSAAHRPPSPLPPPRKKEPLFLSPTPSDEAPSANSQDSAPQPRPTPHSDSPKPGWPFFDPAKKMEDYPQPRYTPSEAPEEDEEQAPRKDKSKGKGKEKEGPPPRTAKKPTIRGKKAGSSAVDDVDQGEDGDGKPMKFGPPGKRRAKKRRVESSESESSEEYEEPARRVGGKKPKIASGAGRDKGKGKASGTKVNAQATKVKPGPKSKIVSSDTISISSSSSEDSSPPVQTPHRRKASKRAPPSDTGADSDSDIEVVDNRVPGSDSDVEVIDGPALKVKRMIRDVFVLMPRMPHKLHAIVERDKAREAKLRESVPVASSSSSSSLVQRSPEASSSKPRPRPVGKKPAADASLDNAPRSSTTIPKPMDNSTAKSLTDSLNAMYAANANPSSDSDSEDDIPLSATHKGLAQKTLQSVVGSSKVKRNDTAASTSAPPLTAKKPRLGSTMPPPASTTRMPPPASTSRMPPPPLPASASAPPRRARGAGQRNDVPCDGCQAAGITECVNAPFPSHRRCQRCHEAGTKCSFKRSGGRASSVARSRAGSVVSSRAGSVVPYVSRGRGRASSVASSRTGSVAPGRAESVAPRVKGTKRPHDGGESASKKRKMLEVEEVLAVPGPSGSKARTLAGLSKMRSTSAVAGPSKGRSQAGPSKPRVLPGSVLSITDSEHEEEDDTDDGEIVEFELPPGATRIHYIRSAPDPSNERRVQSFMKYAKNIHDKEEWWLHLMCPEVALGVLDVEFGDEGDKGFGEGKWGEGGGGEGEGRSEGAGKEKGKGKQKEDQGRRDKEGAGKGKGKQRANGGGYQEGGSKQTLGASSSAPPRTKDGSSKRVSKPKYRPIVPQPELGVHAPAPRYPLPAAQIDPHDAFQPPVVSLASAVSAVAISRPDATNALLAAVENYKAEHASRQTSTVPTPTNARPLSPLKDQSRQTSTVSTPTNALPLSPWKHKYWDSREAQPREPTLSYQPMHPGLGFEPHQELEDAPALEDSHAHEQRPSWNGVSSGSHRDFHGDGGEPMDFSVGSFAAAFAPDAGSSGLAGSAQPGNEPSAVSGTSQLDDVASPGSSQTLHGSEGRSQTIDPSVLGGVGSFMPVDEDSPIKSRPKSSEYESEPELPDIPDPSSDEDFKPTNKPHQGLPKRQLSTRQSKQFDIPSRTGDEGSVPSKERFGPPRRASTREIKPTRKRKAATPPSEAGYSDVVNVPADPTKLFKKGSRGIQWPLGTEKHRCHQCRRLTMRRFMFCTSGKVRKNHWECAYAYCEGCLVTRYGNTFLGLAYEGTEKWDCPACDGFCNCTHCTRGRGEAYLGVRVQDPEDGSHVPRRRAVKSANYGPKSVVAKRTQAEPQPASPAPRPAVKRIRLLPPKPPKAPAPPSEPWVPPKMDYEWPAGVKTELFAPDGYPCGYMWVNEQGQCVTTYTREVIIPGIDADGELYWSEGDVQSLSSSEASEDEEESSYEESPPPPRRKRVPRRREYVGARPLPPPVVKKLWFPHSRKFKFSPEELDFAGQPRAFVGAPPPKFKEGPMSQTQIEFMENYPFSDEEFGMDESVHDDEAPTAMPDHDHAPSQNTTETVHEPSSAPVPAQITPAALAPTLAEPPTTAQADASVLASVPAATPEVKPVSSEESDDGPDVAPSPLTAIGDEDDEELSDNKQWPNDFTRPPTEEVASPAQFNADYLPELLQRMSPAAPAP